MTLDEAWAALWSDGDLCWETAKGAKAAVARHRPIIEAALSADLDRLRAVERDIETLCHAVLGGMAYLPHREAAERVLAALGDRAAEHPDWETLYTEEAARYARLSNDLDRLRAGLVTIGHTSTDPASRALAASMLAALGDRAADSGRDDGGMAAYGILHAALGDRAAEKSRVDEIADSIAEMQAEYRAAEEGR